MNAPGGVRTHDLRFRKPLLYPAELRALAFRMVPQSPLVQSPRRTSSMHQDPVRRDFEIPGPQRLLATLCAKIST